MFRSLMIGRLAGVDLFLHWTMWLLPVVVLARGLHLYSPEEALLQLALVGGLCACLIPHELAQLLVARRVRLGLRDVTLYPVGGSARLRELSERPRKEIWVAAVGPAVFALIAGAVAGVMAVAEVPLSPRIDTDQPYAETFVNRLLWLNVIMAALHLLPVFPLDGGRIFRGALALTAGRVRATEVAALLSSFVALLFLAAGIIWLKSLWFLILVGLIIHLSGQQELMRVRYFAALQCPEPVAPAATPILVPVEQLLDADAKPAEPDFSGCTWSAKNRLWIVWRNGQPVSANAVVGE